ncbi:MAG: hypothetical protein O3A01_03035 [bacterium]|nr:hypothetical protein [bacterium]
MDRNRPKKIEVPKLISEKELSQLDDMLMPRAFQQMKEVILELEGKLQRGELEDVSEFYQALLNRIDDADTAYGKVQKMSKNLAKDAPRGYEKLRMQNMFLDRLKAQETKQKEAPLSAFPLHDVVKHTVSRVAPAPPVPKPVAPPVPPPPPAQVPDPTPDFEIGVAPDHAPVPEATPLVAELADAPVPEAAMSFADIDIKSESLSSIDVNMDAAPQADPSEAKTGTPKKQVKKAPDKKPKAKPKAVKEEPKKEKFYKEQKSRIWDYIDKDQKRSSIDIKE